MKETTQQLLDALIDQIQDEKQFRTIQDQLFKRGIESAISKRVDSET